MQGHDVVTEFEVGKFICPVTGSLVPLMAVHPWTMLDWPVNVASCQSCGQKHEVQLEDLRHPPLFGYE